MSLGSWPGWLRIAICCINNNVWTTTSWVCTASPNLAKMGYSPPVLCPYLVHHNGLLTVYLLVSEMLWGTQSNHLRSPDILHDLQRWCIWKQLLLLTMSLWFNFFFLSKITNHFQDAFMKIIISLTIHLLLSAFKTPAEM